MIVEEFSSLIDNVQNVENSSPSEEAMQDLAKENHPNIHKTNDVQNQSNGHGTSPQDILKTKLQNLLSRRTPQAPSRRTTMSESTFKKRLPPPPLSSPRSSQSRKNRFSFYQTPQPERKVNPNTPTPANSYQNKEMISKDIMELMDFFKGNKNEANEFLRNFGGSASDAAIFIKKFNNIKLAEGWLIKINGEYNENKDNYCGENCKWIFDEKTKTLFIRGSEKMKDYAWDDSKKTSTAPWSSKRGQIENVVIRNSVTAIRWGAFGGCSSLTSITIPESVSSIGREGFCRCSKLSSIHIPKNVKEIGQRAFAECPNLSTLTVDEKNEYFKSVDNVLFTKDGTKLIQYAQAKTETSYIIPDGVAVIADSAFDGYSHLESITIPDSVTTIEDFAFDRCSSLKTITIPESVKTIGANAFQNCSSLASIIIPESVTTIGRHAFYICRSLKSITIQNSVVIRESAFSECPSLTSLTLTGTGEMKIKLNEISKKLATVIISEGITTIGKTAFYWCSSLISITIPNSVTTIGEEAFSECSSLISINVSENNRYFVSIDGILFTKYLKTLFCYPAGKKENSFSIPDSVTAIGERAFSHCSLPSIIIPNSVTFIGGGAFHDCYSLTSITIPNSVTTIRGSAFWGCSSLTTATLPKRFKNQKDAIFSWCDKLKSIKWKQ